MRLGVVKGTVTAAQKDPQLVGQKLLVCDLVDTAGKVTEAAVVAADTVGAGRGDMVLVTLGSAARMLAGTTGQPLDAAICAIVDHVDTKGNS